MIYNVKGCRHYIWVLGFINAYAYGAGHNSGIRQRNYYLNSLLSTAHSESATELNGVDVLQPSPALPGMQLLAMLGQNIFNPVR